MSSWTGNPGMVSLGVYFISSLPGSIENLFAGGTYSLMGQGASLGMSTCQVQMPWVSFHPRCLTKMAAYKRAIFLLTLQ